MKLDAYRDLIDRKIRLMDGSTVLNGSAEHAAVINERMLASATKSVDIISRRLAKEVYGTEPLVREAERFLSDSERKLRISVEEMDGATAAEHPLLSKILHSQNAEVRVLPKRFHEICQLNMTLMDGNSYRFESDKTKPVAVVCFGDKGEYIKGLQYYFDAVWLASEPLDRQLQLRLADAEE